MKFGLRDEILLGIINELKKRGNIKKAALFGSRARGDYRYNSDIDIAIYSDGGMPIGLYYDIDKSAGIYKVNLVDMTDLKNERIKENIVREGIEIYMRVSKPECIDEKIPSP